jgi:hypothetical protein
MRFDGEIRINNVRTKIFIFRDLFSEKEMELIRDGIDTHHCVEERYDYSGNVLADSCGLRHFDNINEIENITMNAFNFIRDNMSKYLFVNTVIDKSYFHFRRIFGTTKKHIDGVVTHGVGSTPTIRVLSIIAGLNNDFKGGELLFPDFNNLKVKVGAGDAIIFPPYWTHVHGTTDLLDGTSRYTINTWLRE